MKTKILSAVSLLLIFAGAMMGDSKNVIPCLSLLAIGSILMVVSVKTAPNEDAKE